MKNNSIISFVLALIMSFSVASFSIVPASAATTTINNFGKGTTLTHKQYDALRTGTISAVKSNGTWYYTFTKDNTKVKVKASAFSSGVANDYSAVNSQLTKGVMATNGIANQTNYVFKKRVGTSKKDVTFASKNSTTLKRLTMSTYTTYLTYLTLTSSRVGTEIDLEAKKNGHVQFSYSDKVETTSSAGFGYQTPQTAGDYKRALTRTKAAVSTTATPKFELKVAKSGSNLVCLNSMMYRGKGIGNTTTEITQMIDVIVTTAKLLASTTPVGAANSLYSLYKQSVKLGKSSSEYVSNNKIYLSKSKNGKYNYCLSAEGKSPIKLNVNKDYFRTEIRLNKKPSTSGTKTQIKATISFS